ncbi:hypothetical protein [Williamsia serinedens]|uniref:Uncharacterized protein n=1 Tax=Williamsia serinedens TaxID=391736 RepID=A0ABT1H3W5_9NOCA|nr:hypothetical protein [Williamsia serinedens]MCP2161876.1 hypothetical protein [Williamsia serinedens]
MPDTDPATSDENATGYTAPPEGVDEDAAPATPDENAQGYTAPPQHATDPGGHP